MKNFIMKSVALSGICVTMILAGCASHEKPYNSRAEEKVARSMDSQIISSVDFVPGRHSLGPKATSEINKAIEAAKGKGTIEYVDVVVWSDLEYPRSGEALPKAEQKLADARGDSVKTFIDRREPDTSIKVINMAERPSPLSKLFDTKDAEIKRKLTALGYAPGPNNSFDSGRPSTALLLIKVK